MKFPKETLRVRRAGEDGRRAPATSARLMAAFAHLDQVAQRGDHEGLRRLAARKLEEAAWVLDRRFPYEIRKLLVSPEEP